MSGQGSVTLDWADGEHTFRLAIGQLRELQEKVNRPRVAIGAPAIGPRTLLALLQSGDVWPDEVSEVLRLGLIGGGMTPVAAAALVRRYVDPPARPVLESAPIAQVVLMAALVGMPDDPAGKKAPAGETTTETATTVSSSPPSTAPAPPSDSPPDRSTICLSGSLPPASTAGTPPTAPTTHLSP